MRYPSLYQINTRVRLTELSQKIGRPATLDDIPDADLDGLAALGLDWVWLLSVWQTGPLAQAISRANAEWRIDFQTTLPDLREEDIAGSGFAVQSYTVHVALGGAAALSRLRQRLQQRGLKLMLDFIPNHMAPDHAWIHEHPDYFVHASEADLLRAPQNYCRVQREHEPLVLAHGRDPYFDGNRLPHSDRQHHVVHTNRTLSFLSVSAWQAGRTRCSSTTPTRHCSKRCPRS